MSSVPFGTNIALYVKRSKMSLYISPGGHFKQLWYDIIHNLENTGKLF